jgi:hypothetical protein
MLGEFPQDWIRFWHLADQEYLQGSGWICIEEKTGKLFVIDLDQDEPVYLLNSSVNNFYSLVTHLVLWTENTSGDFETIKELKGELRLQNQIPQDELEPFWFNIIDATLDLETPRLKIIVNENR